MQGFTGISQRGGDIGILKVFIALKNIDPTGAVREHVEDIHHADPQAAHTGATAQHAGRDRDAGYK